jgi:hypothetical protein
MSFFAYFHRSIVDPSFYVEVIRRPWSTALGYLGLLFAVAVLIMTAARFHYSVSSDKGLTPALYALGKGMSFHNGRLHPPRPTPYVVSREKLSAVVNELLDIRGSAHTIRDSFIVIDTGSSLSPHTYPQATIIMGAHTLYLHPGPDSTSDVTAMPYSAFLPDTAAYHVTQDAVRSLLHTQRVGLCIFFFIQQLIVNAFIILLVTLLLFTTTYVLSPYKTVRKKNYFKMICFALTPVITGKVLVAISGVGNAAGMWILFSLGSLVIVIRAKKRIRHEATM